MTDVIVGWNGRWRTRTPALLLGALALSVALGAPVRSETLPLVPKWERFEQAFVSSILYGNALQQATLTVSFTSPLGETIAVCGFWDGGKVWRVRFTPDQPGRWSFTTACSDPSNRGLEHQTGAFLCTAAAGQNRFRQHGPVSIARDRRHFEHRDGTPFFWLADSTWDGARLSNPKDWETYARIRSAQEFTAVQWAVTPGADAAAEPAFAGDEQVAVNPEFFKRLDAKVDALNRAGLLSVILPFRYPERLPEDQTLLLLRYMVARWGEDGVAWVLRCDGSNPGDVACGKRVGRAVFGNKPRAPVILFSVDRAFDAFRDESWVSAWGYVSDMKNENSLRDLFSGPIASEWKKEPARPLINIEPARESRSAQSRGRTTADDVRLAAWWSLLLAPPAGVSYAAEGVTDWDTTVERQETGAAEGGVPAWQASLLLPGAKQMSVVAAVFRPIQYWRLAPAAQFLAVQPGMVTAQRHIAAAAMDANHSILLYVPLDRSVRVSADALPAWPIVNWINPRTGERSPAVAVIDGSVCQFPTPEPGDWLLTIKAGK